MTFPFLVVHSPEDDMTDYEGSTKLMELSKVIPTPTATPLSCFPVI